MESKKLGELLADRTYSVPPEQRGYSWRPKNIRHFIKDLTNAHEKKKEHQFGLIVFHQPASKKHAQIIDGQQRMTTAVLFLICARNFFFEHQDYLSAKRHLADLTELLCGKPNNNNQRLRLTLSKINRALFEKMIIDPEFKKPTRRKPGTVDDANTDNPEFGAKSNKHLLSAFDRINAQFKTFAGDVKREADFDLVYEYVNTLLTGFFVYTISTAKHAEIYQLFELINNRGEKLSPADHVKAYLLSSVAQSTQDEKITERYDEMWKNIANNITNENTADYNLAKFLNHYLIINEHHRPPSVPALQNLYGGFHTLTKNGATPKSIISDILKWSELFVKIRKADKTHFESPNTIHYLKKINKMGVVYSYPVILGGHEKYHALQDLESFEALVSICCKYHLRLMAIAHTIGNKAYEQQLYKILKEIHNGEKLENIIERSITGTLYPDDNSLTPMLMTRDFTDSAQTIALLEEVEYSNMDKCSRDDTTIEHILPKDTKNWETDILEHKPDGKTDDEYIEFFRAKYLNSLGNQTLLSKDNNAEASKKSLEEKLIVYGKDPKYKITTALIGARHWNGHDIEARRDKLAKKLLREIDLIPIRKRLEARSHHGS